MPCQPFLTALEFIDGGRWCWQGGRGGKPLPQGAVV